MGTSATVVGASAMRAPKVRVLGDIGQGSQLVLPNYRALSPSKRYSKFEINELIDIYLFKF